MVTVTKTKAEQLAEMSDRHVLLIMGLGCRRHPNCFTCPYEDCISAGRGKYRLPIIINQKVIDEDHQEP